MNQKVNDINQKFDQQKESEKVTDRKGPSGKDDGEYIDYEEIK